MAQKFVGVDLGSHTVKLVVVSSGLRGVQVVDVVEVPVVGDDRHSDDLEASIQTALELLRKRGLTHELVGVALPGGLASYRVLRFPFSDPRRIAQAVPFEAEGQFPTPLDQLDYDHVVVPGTEVGGAALIAAVPHDRVVHVASYFKSAGIDLKVITVAGLACAQAIDVQPLETTSSDSSRPVKPVALIVLVGHKSTDFVAVGKNGPVAARSLRHGGRNVTLALQMAYRFDERTAQQAKHSDGFLSHGGLDMSPEQQRSADIVAHAVEPLVREIQQTKLWLKAATGYEIVQLRLGGGGANLHGFAAYLAEQTSLPVELTSPRESGSLRGVTGRDWTSTSIALGTAVATARRPLVQLQEVVTRRSDGAWLQERVSTLSAVGLGVLAFGALDTIAQVKALEVERAVYLAELEETSTKVLGSALTTPQDVQARLAEVEGQDMASQLPNKGALDVLAMVTTATKPQDPPTTPGAGSAIPMPNAVPNPEGGEELTGEEGGAGSASGPLQPFSASGPLLPAAGGEGVAPVALPPVTDPARGIFRDDDVVFSSIDIREHKVELKVTATRSSAQDRLALKLQALGCLTNIQKGKIRDQNDRKTFEMSMDNTCYTSTGTIASTLPSEDEGGGG